MYNYAADVQLYIRRTIIYQLRDSFSRTMAIISAQEMFFII